jgi:hypothetical protein
MKTPEEFVKEYYQLPQSKIETVRIKSLIKCVERYKEYHESEVKKLTIPDVMQRSELLLDFLQWYNDHHPENYIPNSRLGNYLQEKSSNSA